MSKKLRLLLFFYWVGIPAAILVGFSGGPYFRLFGLALPDYSPYLLHASLAHMTLLVLIGLRISSPENMLAGAKIQTAGYLHTLIGFSTALFKIAPENFSIVSLMIPLGSALTTSIIGWFVGGEIAEKGQLSGRDSIRGEIDRVRSELEGFASAMHSIHEKYVETIHAAANEYKKLHEKQSALLEEASKRARELSDVTRPLTEAVKRFESAMKLASEHVLGAFDEDFLAAISKIKESAEMLNKGMSAASSEAQNTAKYLGESRVLISELEKLIDLVSSERKEYEA